MGKWPTWGPLLHNPLQTFKNCATFCCFMQSISKRKCPDTCNCAHSCKVGALDQDWSSAPFLHLCAQVHVSAHFRLLILCIKQQKVAQFSIFEILYLEWMFMSRLFVGNPWLFREQHYKVVEVRKCTPKSGFNTIIVWMFIIKELELVFLRNCTTWTLYLSWNLIWLSSDWN